MKNYKKILMGILGVLLVSIIFAGCGDIFTLSYGADSNKTVSSTGADDGLILLEGRVLCRQNRKTNLWKSTN
jgi:hypothetical protein